MSGAISSDTVRRGKRRAVDGVLLFDKPPGITSHTAVRAVRNLYVAAKAGHTGTLDPLATGLLPVCLGEATKFSHLLLDADKTYTATIRLGLTTTTGDLEGTVITRKPVSVDRQRVESALAGFIGEIQQVPPMYSAIKHEGKPLYKLARAGKVLARTPRSVFIRDLRLLEMSGDEVKVLVACSKGTYVRVLAEDIGAVLGSGGCLSALRREAVGGFTLAGNGVTLEYLESLALAERDALVLPADALVASLPRLDLDIEEARRLTQGRPVERAGAETASGLARIYGPGREFLGIVELRSPGLMIPRRLKSQAGAA